MQKAIHITYPESLANSMQMSNEDFKREIKISALVKLFEIGKVSSAIAAKALGISRVEFLDQLAKYKVSLFSYSDTDELHEDVTNA
jgi:predicted HTH domain antitoxin